MKDSNLRPPGYEPDSLTTDVTRDYLKIFRTTHLSQKYLIGRTTGIHDVSNNTGLISLGILPYALFKVSLVFDICIPKNWLRGLDLNQGWQRLMRPRW